ncbi:MAG: aminotransferase class I/II-fold pyridoxal phosphate-dependent enzyme [Halopseudomonas aestusnigri]
MKYTRMVIEEESPEEYGYDRIRNNLSESSIHDRTFGEFDIDLSDTVLLYGEHSGELPLRQLIAEQGTGVKAEDVLVTAGAAGALFIIATTLLDPDAHLVVVRPNYATNIETPRAIGCDITYIDLSFEDDFKTNVETIRQAITPKTAYISVTVPHNPTGTMMAWDELKVLADIAEAHNCYLLVDETYRDLTYGEIYPTAASLGERVIAVSSLSKAFGTPGIRLGWLITQNKELYTKFLSAKEQIGICGSVIDEKVGVAILEKRQALLAESNLKNEKHLQIVREWVGQEEYIEWVEPAGGVVCFPRIIAPVNFDIEQFYTSLLETHGTYVGPGHWFEMPKTYMRIGFAWPAEAELRSGLEAISAAIREQI